LLAVAEGGVEDQYVVVIHLCQSWGAFFALNSFTDWAHITQSYSCLIFDYNYL
jgi:hypothetical protein